MPPPSPKKNKHKNKKDKPTSGLSVKTYGIKRHHPRKCDFKCMTSKKCSTILTLERKLNEHIKDAHKTFRFICSYCPKCFQTCNTNYKHERKHAGGQHVCLGKGCEKVFMYKKYLENHMKTHSGVGLILCLHCKKKITTNTAMCAHAKIHLNEVHKCSICVKTFTTRLYLLQHSWEKHGKGYIALCGAQYHWPKKMHYHEEHCTDCFELDQKNLKKQKEIHQRIKMEKKANQKEEIKKAGHLLKAKNK